MRNFDLQLAMIEHAKQIKLEKASGRYIESCGRADASRRVPWHNRSDIAVVLKGAMIGLALLLGYIICDGFAEAISHIKW